MRKLLLIALLSGSLAAARANIFFTISMTGSQEVPANLSGAAGGGIAEYDPIANDISVSVFFANLSSPITAAHIHDGAPGVNGPVIVSFVPYIPNPATTAGSIVGGPLAFPSADIADLMAGNTYFNIHDATYPGGEIRGQLVPVPEPSSLVLMGVGALALLYRRRRSLSAVS